MSSSVCQCVFLLACAFVGLSAATSLVSSGGSSPRFSLAQRLQPFRNPETVEQQKMNKVLSMILDMTYEMYREMGASSQALKDLHQKRNLIQTCYFQAVSCY